MKQLTSAAHDAGPEPGGTQPGPVATNVTNLLIPPDAARALSVSERTLFALTKRGDIPAVRIGRAVRYDLADLRAFIERNKAEGGR